MTDSYAAYVSILLHMNGVNNGTTLTDSSLYRKPITAGNSAVTSTNQSKFGGASCYLASTYSYVGFTYADLALGTGDFTIEFWMNPSVGGHGSVDARLYCTGSYQSSGTLAICCNASDNPTHIKFMGSNAETAYNIISKDTVPNGAWTHVAVTRQNGTTYLFVGGVLQGFTTHVFNFNSVPDVRLGSSPYNEIYYGYIDEFRITKGVARYTATFTPPTTAFDDPTTDGIDRIISGYQLTDPRFGGKNSLTGIVMGVTGSRVVRLVHRATGIQVAQTWSNAGNGVYTFSHLAGSPSEYIAYAIDYEDVWNCAIADRPLLDMEL